MPGPLTPAQIDEFKQEGVLLLPNFIDEAQLRSWASQVWAGLAAGSGAAPDDPTTWLGKAVACDMPAPLTPTPGELPQFQGLIEQLGGGHFTGGGAQIAPIFPNTAPAAWKLPSNGHVDGYNGIWSGTGANRVSCTFYLNDVAEQGGCFTYWKGGHRRLHAFFREHPTQIDGRFTKTPEFEFDSHPYKGGDGDKGFPGTQHAAKVKLMKLALQTMNLALQMMNFALSIKMVNCSYLYPPTGGHRLSVERLDTSPDQRQRQRHTTARYNFPLGRQAIHRRGSEVRVRRGSGGRVGQRG